MFLWDISTTKTCKSLLPVSLHNKPFNTVHPRLVFFTRDIWPWGRGCAYPNLTYPNLAYPNIRILNYYMVDCAIFVGQWL